jgi:calcineurin-like phosphoesterase family protein
VTASAVRVLAVSDEVDEVLWHDTSTVASADVVVACGDLPFDYLAHLIARLDVPLVFVPGNHDPDVSGYRTTRRGLQTRAGLPEEPPWPPGAVNADGRVVEVAGLTVAGLGGCLRYSEGPNQYTERQYARRARRLAASQRWRTARGGRPLDLLITHAPPFGVGDAEDPPHHGIRALHRLVERTAPPLLLHGHVHPYGAATPDLSLGGTVVRNVVGRHLFDITVTLTTGYDDEPVGAHRGS